MRIRVPGVVSQVELPRFRGASTGRFTGRCWGRTAPSTSTISWASHDAAFALCAVFHEAAGLGLPLWLLGCDDGIAVSGKVDNQHRVEGLMAAGAIRGVDVKCSPKEPPPMALVNVPEGVKPRARAPCRGKQLLAADALARLGPVEHATGRAMGDQPIDVRRHNVPLLAELCAAFEVEGQVKEPWLPGRAPGTRCGGRAWIGLFLLRAQSPRSDRRRRGRSSRRGRARGSGRCRRRRSPRARRWGRWNRHSVRRRGR